MPHYFGISPNILNFTSSGPLMNTSPNILNFISSGPMMNGQIASVLSELCNKYPSS